MWRYNRTLELKIQSKFSINNCNLDLLSVLVSYTVISSSLNPNTYQFSFLLAMWATSTGKSYDFVSKSLHTSFPANAKETLLVITHLYLNSLPSAGKLTSYTFKHSLEAALGPYSFHPRIPKLQHGKPFKVRFLMSTYPTHPPKQAKLEAFPHGRQRTTSVW